jgi:hypothetical protein
MGSASMSTLKTTNIQHPSAGSPNLVLAADGSVSGGAGLGGLVHIHTESFSAASAVIFDNVFSSEYENYAVIAHAITASGETDAYFRLRASGSNASGSNYAFFNQASGVNGTNYNQSNALTSRLVPGRIGPNGTSSLFINIFRPYIAAQTTFQSQNVAIGTTTVFVQSGGGLHDLSTAYDGFYFYPASSTITGTLRIYGYAND